MTGLRMAYRLTGRVQASAGSATSRSLRSLGQRQQNQSPRLPRRSTEIESGAVPSGSRVSPHSWRSQRFASSASETVVRLPCSSSQMCTVKKTSVIRIRAKCISFCSICLSIFILYRVHGRSCMSTLTRMQLARMLAQQTSSKVFDTG